MKTLSLAALLPCTLAVLIATAVAQSDPVYPVPSSDIRSASSIGNVWDVTTKSGETHHGYVIPRPDPSGPGLSFTVDETTGKTTTVIEGPGYRFIDN